MRAEIYTYTDNCYTVEVTNLEKLSEELVECMQGRSRFFGITVDGMPFFIAPGRVDSVMMYEDDQLTLQHTRITKIKLRKREIERELSPFEELP